MDSNTTTKRVYCIPICYPKKQEAILIKLTHFATTFFIITLLILNACGQTQMSVQKDINKDDAKMTINDIAEAYVKLTLNVGQHYSSYIDAYYGPKEWQPVENPIELNKLKQVTQQLLTKIKHIQVPKTQEQRKEFLKIQLQSVGVFIQQLLKEPLNFKEESLGLYDAISPEIDLTQLDLVLIKLDQLLPGNLPLNQKYKTFQSQFIIDKSKLDVVFNTAINEARRRTKQHISLPKHESFTIEYVNNKVWSGYNWYKGNSYSLIQLNTDFPIYIDRAIDLASHEGYPGHHVFNSQMEQHLVNNNGWIEYSVYPLFSPMSLLAEGSANYGIQVVFNAEDRLKFEQDILFPLAGLDASKAQQYYQVQALKKELSYIDNYVAAQYLDGIIDKSRAIELLMKYSLINTKKAEQRIRFIETNRAYVINYNLGQDLVHKYVDKLTGTRDDNIRWNIFAELLASPKTASMMH
jgi:hypothetical protein